MFTYQENLRAIAAMCVAIAGFIANDALIKLASETLPLGEIIFIRGVITGLAMVAIIRFRGEMNQLHHMVDRKVLARTIMEVCASIAYLLALFKMPIADNWQFRLDNTALAVVDTFPEGSILSLFNDTSHLKGLC